MLLFQKYHQIFNMKGDAITNTTTNIVVSNMDKHPSSGIPSAPPAPIYVYHVQGQIFGYDEVNIDCPYCKIGITTKIKRKRGSYPWILCGILSVFGCFLCSCIPFCANNLKSVIMFYSWWMHYSWWYFRWPTVVHLARRLSVTTDQASRWCRKLDFWNWGQLIMFCFQFIFTFNIVRFNVWDSYLCQYCILSYYWLR